ncbi:MAG: glycerophosphodiester phosphodiesterase family protein [Clostridiales bacterium]|nr:glycerophosphodiester phosphodiesterase family protein [Clostridiales bacterium]
MNTTVEQVRNEYGLNDFKPLWLGKLNVRPDMCDFEEKKRTFYQFNSRMMVCAHRGDNNNLYPENSLEGTESVLLAGADMVETDVHLTKDGVAIIMHDPTVSRTTDAENYLGKPGFPESDSICDWTFEQIRALRLRAADGTVTNCLVPTLMDQILLCKDRAFLTLDKHNEFDWDRDIYPLIQKADAYETVLIPYTYSPARAREITEKVKADSGKQIFYFANARVVPADYGDHGPIRKAIADLQAAELPVCLRGSVRGYDKEHDAQWAEKAQLAAEAGGKLYIETLARETDFEENWRRIIEMGCGYLMGNKIYEHLALLSELYPAY